MKAVNCRDSRRKADNTGAAGALGALRGRALRAAAWQTTLGLFFFGLGTSASATPTTASLHVKVVPIPVNQRVASGPSYPHTGNVLGEGAAFEGELQIHGDEYGGFPPPLTGVEIFVPSGFELHPQGFPICPQPVLESHEVANCPKLSQLATGSASGVVSFGASRVHETLSLQGFFAAGGRLAYYAEGTSPSLIEILEFGTVTGAGGVFGHKYTAPVPLVTTVPEAPYAVVLSIHLRIGAAYRQGTRVIPYVTLPTRCPKSGLPTRVRLSFLTGAPVQIDLALPCPARH